MHGQEEFHLNKDGMVKDWPLSEDVAFLELELYYHPDTDAFF